MNRTNLRDSYRKGHLDGKQTNHGSKTYQKFFEGYDEITVPKKDGNGYRIRRLYKGEYYRQDLSAGRWIFLKIIYSLLFLISFGIFTNAALSSTPANSVWYVTIFQSLDVIFYLWSFSVLCSYVVSARNMTISKYKRACVPFKYAFRSTSIALLLTVFLNIIFLFMGAAAGSNAIYLIEYSISALLILLVDRIESKISYVVLEEADES